MLVGLRLLRARSTVSTTKTRVFARARFTPNTTFRFSSTQTEFEEDLDDMAAKEKVAKVAVQQLKTPKGTRDWVGADMLLRDHIFNSISDVFKRHGGVSLDTPVFELKEVLSGKYGEDAKLIYDLADQGGELCALRYDLTVPFARWLAMSGTMQVKRYQIAKVYRRDQPSVARGRMREFYQCDFDIAGTYDQMIPDAEILRITSEIFSTLKMDISISINHRQILDGMFAVAGVPEEKVRTISSAVDKLDKSPWADVKKEMVDEKGLPEEVADRIGEYVKHNGRISTIVEFLKGDATMMANENIKAGIADMELLSSYLDAFGVGTKVVFDLALARGLDYYTGIIYEVKTNLPPEEDKKKKKGNDELGQVGSIAAGGRYDNLVGMYGKRQIPCVGISFGVDRIYTIMKARQETEGKARVREVDVYVMAFGGSGFTGLLLERMQIARKLWDAGIKAEFQAKVKPKLPQQFKAADDVPLGVILGEDELKNKEVRLKRLNTGAGEEEDRGQLVKIDDLVDEIKRLL